MFFFSRCWVSWQKAKNKAKGTLDPGIAWLLKPNQQFEKSRNLSLTISNPALFGPFNASFSPFFLSSWREWLAQKWALNWVLAKIFNLRPTFVSRNPYDLDWRPLQQVRNDKSLLLLLFFSSFLNPFEYGKSSLDKSYTKRFGTITQTKP